MKYVWNDAVITLKHDDKFAFVNPKSKAWLKTKIKVKEMIDNIIKGNEIDNISKDKKDEILNRFINSGIISTNKETNSEISVDEKSVSSIYLMITKKCNLKCSFCSLGCSPEIDEPVILNMDNIKHIIDELSNYKIGSIIITGGEPTIRKDLLEIIDYIHDKLNCKLILETNALLIDSNFIEKVKEKVYQIDISFENIFEKDAKWQYEKIVDVVKKLKDNQVSTVFSYVTTSENYDNVFEFIDLAVEYNPKHVIIRNVCSIGNAKNNKKLLLDDKEIFERYKQIYEYLYERQYDLPWVESFVRTSLIPRYNCSAKGDTMFVYSDGRVYSCPSLFHDEFCYGNILENGVKEVFENRSEKIKSTLYQKSFHIDERLLCKECDLKYFCGGNCFAEIYENKHDVDKLPPDCELRKILINYNLWEYDSKISFLDNLKNIIELLNEKSVS